MHNELFSIGPVTVYGYGLMIAIGVLAAYFAASLLAKKQSLDPDPVFSLLLVGVGFGILGAKLLYYITIFDEILANPKLLLDVGDGFVVYGGVILGIAAAYLYCRIKKLPFLSYLDCAAPAIALAQGFGRIGCFLAGCCYGIPFDSPISVTFQHSDFAPNGIPLFPTQLVSSGLNFLHFLLLTLLLRSGKLKNRIGPAYLIFYSVGRFGIEFLRGDLERGKVGALSTSQFISLFVAAAGIALLFLLTVKQKRTPAVAGEALPDAEDGGEEEKSPETGGEKNVDHPGTEKEKETNRPGREEEKEGKDSETGDKDAADETKS